MLNVFNIGQETRLVRAVIAEKVITQEEVDEKAVEHNYHLIQHNGGEVQPGQTLHNSLFLSRLSLLLKITQLQFFLLNSVRVCLEMTCQNLFKNSRIFSATFKRHPALKFWRIPTFSEIKRVQYRTGI